MPENVVKRFFYMWLKKNSLRNYALQYPDCASKKNLALGTLSSNFNQYNPALTIFVAGNRHVYIL